MFFIKIYIPHFPCFNKLDTLPRVWCSKLVNGSRGKWRPTGAAKCGTFARAIRHLRERERPPNSLLGGPTKPPHPRHPNRPHHPCTAINNTSPSLVLPPLPLKKVYPPSLCTEATSQLPHLSTRVHVLYARCTLANRNTPTAATSRGRAPSINQRNGRLCSHQNCPTPPFNERPAASHRLLLHGPQIP